MGVVKTEIFFQRGLDDPNQIEKSRQFARQAQRQPACWKEQSGQFSLETAGCGCSSSFKAAAPVGGGVRTEPQPCGRQESDFGRAIRLGNENAGGELHFDRAVHRPVGTDDVEVDQRGDASGILINEIGRSVSSSTVQHRCPALWRRQEHTSSRQTLGQ